MTNQGKIMHVSPERYIELQKDILFLPNSVYLRKIDYNPLFGELNVKGKVYKEIFKLLGKPYLLQTYEPLCEHPDAVGVYKGKEVIIRHPSDNSRDTANSHH